MDENFRNKYNVLGQNGATLILNTLPSSTGPYFGFLVVADAVFNPSGTVINEWDGGDIGDCIFLAGMWVPGLFAQIQLASGHVIAYKA